MTRNELLTSFAQGYESLKATLEQAPAGSIDFRPSPETWTIREIIHHMPDSEASGFVRCRKIIAESGVTVDVYDQDIWTDKLKYRSRDITHALELFRLMRLTTLDLLRTVEEPVWANNYVMHPERGRLTLQQWLEVYAHHGDSHAGQIRRNVEAWEKAGRPKS